MRIRRDSWASKLRNLLLIPPALYRAGLKTLHVASCDRELAEVLTAAIPGLHKLACRQNLPTCTSMLTDLQTLVLENEVCRELPECLPRLLSLKRLTLRRMKDDRIDSIASRIELLTRLEELRFDDCWLSHFPSAVSVLTNLRVLEIRTEPLVGIEHFQSDELLDPKQWIREWDRCLAQLTGLEELSLSGCELTDEHGGDLVHGQLPASISLLQDLRVLKLNHFDMQVSLPAQAQARRARTRAPRADPSRAALGVVCKRKRSQLPTHPIRALESTKDTASYTRNLPKMQKRAMAAGVAAMDNSTDGVGRLDAEGCASRDTRALALSAL